MHLPPVESAVPQAITKRDGLQVFAWQLAKLGVDPKTFAKIMKDYRVTRVSIKINDHLTPWNDPNRNGVLIHSYADALREQDIIVDGWGYLYPANVVALAKVIYDLCVKYGINAYDLDMEGEWKGVAAQLCADFMSALNPLIHYSFCSFRYPYRYHNTIPYNAILSSPKIKAITPQVYWLGRQDSVAQVKQSQIEYKRYQGGDKQFVPIGSMFGSGLPDGSRWEPSRASLEEFAKYCAATYETCGWWSIDWVLQNDKLAWLEYISSAFWGTIVTPPPPAQSTHVQVSIANANLRNAPLIANTTDVGDLHVGSRLKIIEKTGEWYKVEGYVHKSVVTEVYP